MEKALRYALQSLPSPKMKTAPIRVASGIFPKLAAPQVWHDELETFADKLAIGFDFGSVPASTAIGRFTWTPEGMKYTPISERDFYAAKDADTALTSLPNKA
ncbi:MAG: hypothetical protein IT551_02470 [Novosphingobium sp.]|nr:hypothetical protein [Novosphingobium sp.]